MYNDTLRLLLYLTTIDIICIGISFMFAYISYIVIFRGPHFHICIDRYCSSPLSALTLHLVRANSRATLLEVKEIQY